MICRHMLLRDQSRSIPRAYTVEPSPGLADCQLRKQNGVTGLVNESNKFRDRVVFNKLNLHKS